MKLPFILNYSEDNLQIENGNNDFVYHYEKDVLVWNDNKKEPVVNGDIPIQLSGSYITKAKEDSTSDESTDR
ncbi:hypothetical protein BX659_11018 [Orenia metallireducens]|uniref:Uncharacterized protein n=1 Tax=Orenia metallireducens TaxID=1413210 RepID=A0A285HY26_9FIRM|nr:hypothetical protein [Orenia metallireducens]PRX29274.1 hypothetical protein BX659_11018 [Orenia metallireducens]SNY40605.1 hypothetical protein SAMN06265827_12718 [Orenia metallireducens]